MTQDNHSGFTLLEILISVGILAVIGILISQVFFSVTRISTKTELLKDIKQNGDFVLDVIERHIRNASEAQIFCDAGIISTSSATFLNRKGESTTFTCFSDGNAARIASISAMIAFLSSGNLTISESGDITCQDSTLSFSCPDASGLKKPIIVRFTLSQIGQRESVFEIVKTNFETSVTLRN